MKIIYKYNKAVLLVVYHNKMTKIQKKLKITMKFL